MAAKKRVTKVVEVLTPTVLPKGPYMVQPDVNGDDLLVPLAGPDPDEDGAQHTSHAEKVVRAMTLRMSGATYKQIATALDISVNTARNLVVQSLDEAVLETAGSMARLQHARLEHMFLLLWREVNTPRTDDEGRPYTDKQAIAAALAVLDRLERLWGTGPQHFAQTDDESIDTGVLVIGIEKDDYMAGLRAARKQLERKTAS